MQRVSKVSKVEKEMDNKPDNKKVEQTLVLIKPDGLVKSLTGNIITSISHPKLRIVGAKIVSVTKEMAEEHYQHLKEESFFNEVIKYIMGEYHTKRIMALVYEGEGAIQRIREVAGLTNPEDAHPESIRGKYGRINSKSGVFENVIHCSANQEDAEREIKLWFRPEELVHVIYPTEMRKANIDLEFWKE
jgi:nucleoside-diphosphate kinase